MTITLLARSRLDAWMAQRPTITMLMSSVAKRVTKSVQFPSKARVYTFSD